MLSNHVVIHVKILFQIYTYLNGFEFDFSKFFCGAALKTPLQVFLLPESWL